MVKQDTYHTHDSQTSGIICPPVKPYLRSATFQPKNLPKTMPLGKKIPDAGL